ncbi:VIT1/CCC1 transporter family protein [Butyricimonas hominis]|uniref:VIT1/CCC1 transporter family protein n=1 Tax=Butyricimonas TaxID=574697 RepID=UPI00351833CD
MTPEDIKQLVDFQVNEITESKIYSRLANIQKDTHNSEVLKELSAEELKHYHILKKYTGKSPSPKHWKITLYVLIARFFGLTFGIKLMEKGEVHAQDSYRKWADEKDLQTMADEEEVHESKLIGLLDEEGLNYMGAVVLGLNDALVEFTGALAGYTFALQNPKLIALTGSITGIAAALSMAASEYLSSRAENDGKNAIKAAIYTGIAYIITVVVLIMPFVVMSNPYRALVVCLTGAITIIAIFNYYYSIVKDENFRKRFLEMAAISLGIAAISFGIGYALRVVTGIDL